MSWLAAAALGVLCLTLGGALILRERRFDRLDAERAGAERRQRALEMALETVASGIVALDPEGRIELANPPARRMLGLGARADGREFWPEHVRFDTAEGAGETPVSPVWAILAGRRIAGAEYLLTVRDAPAIRVRVNAEPAPLGAPLGAVLTLEDVTEQHRARVLGDRAERLDALGKLTGGVAHDFNNLLSTIMGAVQLARRRSGDDPRIAGHLDAALRATRTGAELVERLLGFAKRGGVRLEDASLCELFAEIAPLAANAAPASIRIQFVPPPEGATARCDRPQLVTAMLNLVANARDAIGERGGGGEIRVSARPSAERPGFWEIAVADDGPGMTPEVRARALDPFFTTKDAARGTGLGLSMVYGALRRCGGDLRIDSAPGRGATVRMLLPQGVPTAPAGEPGVVRFGNGAGRAVLLVEDEADLLETATGLLTELGFAVIPAPDGPAALRELARGLVVDILLTDVMMPGGLSGIDLAREARAMRPRMPVVLASGYADAVEAAAKALGAEMVRKPYALEELAAVLQRAFDTQSRSVSGETRPALAAAR